MRIGNCGIARVRQADVERLIRLVDQFLNCVHIYRLARRSRGEGDSAGCRCVIGPGQCRPIRCRIVNRDRAGAWIGQTDSERGGIALVDSYVVNRDRGRAVIIDDRSHALQISNCGITRVRQADVERLIELVDQVLDCAHRHRL